MEHNFHLISFLYYKKNNYARSQDITKLLINSKSIKSSSELHKLKFINKKINISWSNFNIKKT